MIQLVEVIMVKWQKKKELEHYNEQINQQIAKNNERKKNEMAAYKDGKSNIKVIEGQSKFVLNFENFRDFLLKFQHIILLNCLFLSNRTSKEERLKR